MLYVAVGRWQRNKDLSWYAKGDDSQAAKDAAQARAEEIKRIKEAEQDALSAALGFAVVPRIRDSQIAGSKEVEKAIKETGDDEENEGGKGVGFGGYGGASKPEEDSREILMGYVGEKGGLEGGTAKKEKRRGISRERDGERRRQRHDREHHRSHRRHRSRSRERDIRRRSRSRSYERRRSEGHPSRRHRERSYSPDPRRRDSYRDSRYERRR